MSHRVFRATVQKLRCVWLHGFRYSVLRRERSTGDGFQSVSNGGASSFLQWSVAQSLFVARAWSSSSESALTASLTPLMVGEKGCAGMRLDPHAGLFWSSPHHLFPNQGNTQVIMPVLVAGIQMRLVNASRLSGRVHNKTSEMVVRRVAQAMWTLWRHIRVVTNCREVSVVRVPLLR